MKIFKIIILRSSVLSLCIDPSLTTSPNVLFFCIQLSLTTFISSSILSVPRFTLVYEYIRSLNLSHKVKLILPKSIPLFIFYPCPNFPPSSTSLPKWSCQLRPSSNKNGWTNLKPTRCDWEEFRRWARARFPQIQGPSVRSGALPRWLMRCAWSSLSAGAHAQQTHLIIFSSVFMCLGCFSELLQ